MDWIKKEVGRTSAFLEGIRKRLLRGIVVLVLLCLIALGLQHDLFTLAEVGLWILEAAGFLLLVVTILILYAIWKETEKQNRES